MEINLNHVLIGSIIFNFILVVAIMYGVRKVKRDQQRRQRRMLDQAKVNATLEEIVNVKNQTIDSYRSMAEKR